MKPLGWAIVGPGRIAHRFAAALAGLPATALVGVHGRDEQHALAFARQWARPGGPAARVAPDLATLLAQPDVDAVYIATPHSLHGSAVQACLLAGKPVLCEKPLVPSLAQAQALVALAQERQVFLMEAMWTRFLPVYDQVGDWLREQAIGPLRGLQSSFCLATPFDATSRLFDPALAGGALLDIGIYNLSMTRWVLQQALGECPPLQGLHAQGRLAPTGVDQRVAATLDFGQGLVSQFVCGFDGTADNGLRIFGERGHIEVPQQFWQATQALLHRDGEAPLSVEAPLAINGFEGEITEAMRCIRAGAVQSPLMPHRETLATMGWLDRLRQAVGVRYPGA